MNQEKKVVKISDVIQNQVPEFIASENPNFVEFLTQYYISQEFQGSTVDIAENLISYKNIDSFDSNNLVSETTLSSDVDFTDDVIVVESTNGWPKEYGLLKIDNEIITYTGITSTSFTGCIRGFSGISSLSQENNPEFLVFSQTEAEEHNSGTKVQNLSNLFLREFFEKIKYQFTPGFEDLEFAPQINPQNFISKVRSFYQSKGTDEAFKILFKVLYAQDVVIIKPDQYCFTSSDDKWRVVETFVCELVSGDPLKIKGQTLYQDNFPQYQINSANGSIYDVEPFSVNGKNYYKINIFSGYSNNLNPKGSIEGTFSSTPRTYVTEDINSDSNYITVDSTVGFANSGKLEIDGLIISYTDKTNNQFLNCSGINTQINKKTKVFSDHFVYSFEENTSNLVKFKLYNVLSKLVSSDVKYALDGDPIEIDQFGSVEKSTFLNSLYYNLASSVACGVAVTNLTSEIRTNTGEAFSILSGNALSKYPHYLRTGDKVDLFLENTDQLVSENLNVSVVSPNEFLVPVVGIQNSILGKNVIFKRKIKKSQYLSLNLTSNIQDSYVDSDSYYLTSNGLPEFPISPLTFEKQFTVVGVSSSLECSGIHYFKTGDEVSVLSYQSTQNYRNDIGIQTGKSYYVVNDSQFGNRIFLTESRDNIESQSYVNFVEYDNRGIQSGTITNLNITVSSQYGRNFESSKIFKKFPKTIKVSNEKQETDPGNIGIFVNGVELRNYKSFDKVYYGPIESVTILNSGLGYNLLNPPQFRVKYEGQEYPNTKLIPELRGKLAELSVTDPGFDYIEVPSVKVVGGNNPSIVTEVKMKRVVNEVSFNATTKDTVINAESNTFTFDSRHRFVTGEPVIYKTNGTTPIGIGTQPSDGFLVNDSIYYVVNIGVGTSMRLAFTQEDALSEINLINIRTFGGGFQSFVSTISKQGVDEVNIVQNENDFVYKKLSFISEDVNLLDDIITVENHGFSTGDEVVYSFVNYVDPNYSGNGIDGLLPQTYYYVYKIDDNRFRLSTTKNYSSYVDFTSADSQVTNFLEYSPIRVEITGTISVDGLSDLGYSATVIPIVKGEVVDVKVQRNPKVTFGTGEPLINEFGNKNILNYEKSPSIEVIEGEGASFEPLIENGKIIEVIVKSSGSGYFNSFDLVVSGSGFGAKLEPVIVNGSIVGVDVVSSGVNYSPTDTVISINTVGKNLRLKANLKTWTVNQVDKDIDVRDGAVSGKNYSLYGNSYGVYYLTQKLKDFFEGDNVGASHSPIIGWAYDGCPIYGPFGYTNPDGTGGISRMRSGYNYKTSINSNFRLVEEYVFENTGTLDKYNGRFCITPEYPNGVYAYFCTLDNLNVPEFPYVIGPQYNCEKISENFDLKNNQTLNFNNLNIVKWTSPYRVEDKNHRYEFFEFFSSNKDIVIEKSSSGVVDRVDVIDGGINYKVNDSIVFNHNDTSGFGAIAKVSEVLGVGVTNISSSNITLNDVTFISDQTSVIGIVTTYHNFKNNSFINISGINTDTYKSIEGFKKINVESVTSGLSSSIQSAAITGIVTSINVKSSLLNFEIDSNLKIGSEIVTVVGLDYQNNLLNILRPVTGPAHSVLDTVELLPNKFSFSAIDLVSKITTRNQAYYFNPSQSVSIGSTIAPGIGNTLTIYPLGVGIPYTKYAQCGSIYLPNNKFNTGDKISYSYTGSPIVTNYGILDTINDLYIIKLEKDLVGIVTNKSHISDQSKVLTYTSSGSGSLHKFTTENDVVTGTVTQTVCTVSTGSSHGLSVNDSIKINVVSGVTTTFVVTYSNNRVLINSQVNPKLNVYANETVIFDISSPSLSGKTFDLYSDENFLNSYVGNTSNGIEVSRSSTQVTLRISNDTPRKLYYNLSNVITDIDVEGNNEINIDNSRYNSETVVSDVINDYQFIFNLDNIPERQSYQSPSRIVYTVLSEGAVGSIVKTSLQSKGSNYKKLPKILKVESESGIGCNLFVDSDSIGKIESTRVNNTQFICPTDNTLKPQSKVFSALKLTDNYTVDSINIISTGKNYFTAPKIKLYNSKKDQLVTNFSAAATLKNNSIDSVTILNPGFGLSSEDSEIVVTDNTNGFKIINVSVSGSSPYLVTLTLKTPTSGFSTSNPLPIQTGDKIFVEGIKYDGNGFNSADYNYQPFVVSFADPAYGSQDAAIIRYELTTNPGTFNSQETFNAYVTPYSYIPELSVTLKQNEFYNKEIIGNTQIIDNVGNLPITDLIKVKNSDSIQINQIISASSSNSEGTVREIKNFNSVFNSDYSVSETLGGVENRGYLSSNIQKLSDNDYYQKFSYSLKSSTEFDDWNSPVSDTAHIAGYKKFSDLSIESVGIGLSSLGSNNESVVNVILDSYVNVNSISDYDLVNEIDLEDNDFNFTEYLRFSRLKLGNSIQSTDNRVLSIDDISNLFNSEITIPKIEVDKTTTVDSLTLKYQLYLTGTGSFFGDFIYPETFELLVSKQNDNNYLTAYSYYYDTQNYIENPFLGEFTVEVNPEDTNELILYFSPKNPFVTVDIKAVKETTPSLVGIATTSFGYVKNVEICQQHTGIGSTNLYSISSNDCKSGTLIIGISSSLNSIEKSFEVSFIDTGVDILISKYADNILKDLGDINIVKNGSNIEFNYTGVGIGVTVHANLKLLTNTYYGFDSINRVLSKSSSSQIFTNSTSTGISTVSGVYGYTKYVMEVEKTVGVSTQRSIVQLNSIHFENHLSTIAYDINGNIGQEDLIFETNYNIVGNTYTLFFNPSNSADYKITIYESNILNANQ